MGMELSEPPFQETYKTLFQNINGKPKTSYDHPNDKKLFVVEECDLPLIDLSRLKLRDKEKREECKREIAKASSEWGFFQVVNHGISREILERMSREQMKVFRQPFKKKVNERLLNFSPDSYRWGTPTATCLRQFSWSEAFHIPLTDISRFRDFNHSLSSTMEEFAATVSDLAQRLAEMLAENLGFSSAFFKENCLSSTCYLRMNRYPPCPISSSEVFGLMPHTDSDFLTILYQDEVGGLQLVKNGRWITVKPNPEALIINIGDLFQAWSNGVYRSAEHRVTTNGRVERLSIAYFFCPSYDAVIQSRTQPSLYKKFTFREYRKQVQDDVQKTGYKIGLSRFLL